MDKRPYITNKLFYILIKGSYQEVVKVARNVKLPKGECNISSICWLDK